MLLQHDPEDEPVVASLDPEYFEFDSKAFHGPAFSPLSHIVPPIAVHKEELSKDQLKGTLVGLGFDDPVFLCFVRPILPRVALRGSYVFCSCDIGYTFMLWRLHIYLYPLYLAPIYSALAYARL